MVFGLLTPDASWVAAEASPRQGPNNYALANDKQNLITFNVLTSNILHCTISSPAPLRYRAGLFSKTEISRYCGFTAGEPRSQGTCTSGVFLLVLGVGLPIRHSTSQGDVAVVTFTSSDAHYGSTSPVLGRPTDRLFLKKPTQCV